MTIFDINLSFPEAFGVGFTQLRKKALFDHRRLKSTFQFDRATCLPGARKLEA